MKKRNIVSKRFRRSSDFENQEVDFLRTPSCNRASGNFDWYPTFQSEMNADHFHGDHQYSWDDYIEA